METKMSFNKRVSLVKKAVFEGVTNSKELDNIKGTDKTGFYSIATIEKHLNPALDKYDIDLDLVINENEIVGIWIDCEGDSEKTRSVNVDFSRIKAVGKLQLMANEVQSEGAVKSYTRRYALTSILRLPSTDIIDSNALDDNGQTSNKTKTSPSPFNTQKTEISDGQIKRIYAIAKAAGMTETEIKEMDNLIKEAYGIESKKYMTKADYDSLTKYLSENGGAKTIEVLKLRKSKKGVA